MEIDGIGIERRAVVEKKKNKEKCVGLVFVRDKRSQMLVKREGWLSGHKKKTKGKSKKELHAKEKKRKAEEQAAAEAAKRAALKAKQDAGECFALLSNFYHPNNQIQYNSPPPCSPPPCRSSSKEES